MEITGVYPGSATSDIKASLAFYTEVLGYSIKHQIEAGSIKVCQLEREEQKMDLVECKAIESGKSVIRVNVRDFDAAKAQLEEGNCKKIVNDIIAGQAIAALYEKKDGSIILLMYHIRY